MPRKYTPDMWDLDSLFDSTRYQLIPRCVSLVESQVEGFDERQGTEFAEEFGSLIQSAFLMAVIAHMEDHLKKICDVLAEQRNLIVRVNDMRGGRGFGSCVVYLEKVLQLRLPEDELKLVRGIVAVRNAFVHDGGYMKEQPSIGDAGKWLQWNDDGRLEFVGPFVQGIASTLSSFITKVEGIAQDEWTQLRRNAGRDSQ